jgi:mannose-6-phosphate isomerase-like protein (cupin superfamily)
MKGFVRNIEDLVVSNEDFRKVLYTSGYCQLVVMALKPGEEIGAEVHKLDQFFRVEEGAGEAVLDGVRTAIRAGFAVVVPAGANHNIINTGSVPLKLYTLYSPPNHRDGVVHATRAEAEADLKRLNPQGRFVTPQEVADTVLWLCTPAAQSITGQAISVSGGEV